MGTLPLTPEMTLGAIQSSTEWVMQVKQLEPEDDHSHLMPVKVKVKLIKHQAMKAYWGVEV
jgi:hypothetical protein